MATQFKLKNTIKYPTSVIVNGVSPLGFEIAESLLAQGGYVVLIDSYNDATLGLVTERFGSSPLLSFLDLDTIPHLRDDMRRLDYVFYLAHEGGGSLSPVSTQYFLKYSNYLDEVLGLATKFEAKFLLTTSIKAHQLLLSRMDIDMNFGKNVDSLHTIYTHVEVQRYAESLTLEYVSKTALNARIVRLGEIIGEGMDFADKTHFVKLVLSAVSGDNLELVNDGLDTEWFVHLLDAAYGVIKAQFSKNTQGEIYSLAYDGSITYLSLAYKLQEYEPLAKEINFKDDESSLPAVRLHKQAPNLSAIGWRPRIDFEQALSESVAAAKLFLLKSQTVPGSAATSGLMGKVKGFLAVSDRPPTPAELEMLSSGPVSRLIAERKQQEVARMKSVEKASTEIKSQKYARARTPLQRFKDWIWRNFLDSRTNFPFLRNVTPAQFLVYILIAVLLTVIYFGLFSPVLVFGRNVFIINSALEQLEQEDDIDLKSQASQDLYAAFAENLELLNRYQGVMKLVGMNELAFDLISTHESFALVSEGLKDIYYAAAPMSEYLAKYESNLQFRLNTETYLAVNGPGSDYSVIWDEIANRRAYIESGNQKLTDGLASMYLLSDQQWPPALAGIMVETSRRLKNIADTEGVQQLTQYGGEILGVESVKKYLVVVVDNSRPMPVGGMMSAYALITMRNGSITDVRVQSMESIGSEKANIPTYIVNELNLLSWESKSASSLTVGDLAFIGDYQLFAESAASSFSKILGTEIDSVITINLNSLESLLTLTGPIEVENEQIGSGDILPRLRSLQSSTETSARRNDLITQIVANLLNKISHDLSQNFFSLLDVVSKAAGNKDLVIPLIDAQYTEVVVRDDYDSSAIKKTDLPLSIFFVSDAKIVSPQKYPAITQTVQMQIRADSSIDYDLNVKFPAVSNVDAVGVCGSLAYSAMQVSGTPIGQVRQTRANNKVCTLIDVITESELSLSWSSIPIASFEQTEYNIGIGNAKPSGVDVRSEVEVNLDPGLNFLDVNPDLPVAGSQLLFTQTLKMDQIVELVIGK